MSNIRISEVSHKGHMRHTKGSFLWMALILSHSFIICIHCTDFSSEISTLCIFLVRECVILLNQVLFCMWLGGFLDGLSGRILTVPQFNFGCVHNLFLLRLQIVSGIVNLAQIWKCIIAFVGQFDLPCICKARTLGYFMTLCWRSNEKWKFCNLFLTLMSFKTVNC